VSCVQDPLTVAWARENGLLPAGRARDDGRGLLIITAVRAEDSGTYVCTATSGQFVATQSAQLTVTGKAVFTCMDCKENPIYVFLFWELRGLSPNFHIHVSVNDLYIPRIGPHISLQQNRQTDTGNK
jgi:hypothetical protein